MTSFIRLGVKRMKEVIVLKKNIIMLLTLFAFMVSVVSVHAAPRTISIKPSISFDGTTAKCNVSIVADKMSDSINATIVLWDGSKIVDSWTASAIGYLLFSNSAQTVKGKTYKLTVDTVIGGIAKPQVSVEGTCGR